MKLTISTSLCFCFFCDHHTSWAVIDLNITWCIVTSQRAGHAVSKLILGEKLPRLMVDNCCLLLLWPETSWKGVYIYIRFHKHHTRSARTKSKKGWNGSVQCFVFGCSVHAAMLRVRAPVYGMSYDVRFVLTLQQETFRDFRGYFLRTG